MMDLPGGNAKWIEAPAWGVPSMNGRNCSWQRWRRTTCMRRDCASTHDLQHT